MLSQREPGSLGLGLSLPPSRMLRITLSTGSTSRTWAHQSAILLTEGASTNISLMIREMIRGQNWKLAEITDSVPEAFAKIAEGSATLLIVSESEKLPAPWVVKAQLQHKIALLTPTIYLLAPPSGLHDAATIGQVMAHAATVKPISPERMLPAFIKLVATWSRGPFAQLRQAAMQLTMKNERTALEICGKLATNPQVSPLVCACMALFLTENGDYRAAEKILLSGLKLAPKNYGIILALVAFYMRAAMPNMALRLLTEIKANSHLTGQKLIYTDLIMANLMLNRVADAVPILEEMIRRDYLPDVAKSFLARILFTEGMRTDFDRLMRGNNAIYLRFLRTWAPERGAERMKAG